MTDMANTDPKTPRINQKPAAERIADEPLLDILGSAAVLGGLYLASQGKTRDGTQLAVAGFAAIGGKKVLQNHLAGQLR